MSEHTWNGRIDLSEASEWDGSQAQPNLSRESTEPKKQSNRTVGLSGICSMGECAKCGRWLLSAVEVEWYEWVYLGQENRKSRYEMRPRVLCGACYDWTKP